MPWFAITDLNPYPPRARLLFPVWSRASNLTGFCTKTLLFPASVLLKPLPSAVNPHHAGLLPYSAQLSHHPFHSPTSSSILCSRKQPVIVASPLPFSDHPARSVFSSEICRSSIVLVFFWRYLTPLRYSADPPVFRRHPVRPCYRAPLHRCLKKKITQARIKKGKKWETKVAHAHHVDNTTT